MRDPVTSRLVKVTPAHSCALAPARPFPRVARDRFGGAADPGRLYPVTSSPTPRPHLGASPTPLRASSAPGSSAPACALSPPKPARTAPAWVVHRCALALVRPALRRRSAARPSCLSRPLPPSDPPEAGASDTAADQPPPPPIFGGAWFFHGAKIVPKLVIRDNLWL